MELSLEKSDTRYRFKQLAPRPITRVKILKHTKPVEQSSAIYQQQCWEKLKKRFAFLVSIINAENILLIKERIYKFNIVRAKGLLCSAILVAQLFQTKNTDLYAFMVSLINLDFPNLAELLLIRCIWQLKSGYRQHCITVYSSSAIFIAHLIYRGVADVSLGLDVLKLLFRYPTDEDLIKTAIMFYTICGEKMKKKYEKAAILYTVHHMSLHFEFSSKVRVTIERDLLKPKTYNIPNLSESTATDGYQNIVHKLNFDGIEDPLDYFDYFEVDVDFIANNKMYQLQVQNPLNLNDYGQVNESDDADDEEEEED